MHNKRKSSLVILVKNGRRIEIKIRFAVLKSVFLFVYIKIILYLCNRIPTLGRFEVSKTECENTRGGGIQNDIESVPLPFKSGTQTAFICALYLAT